jgi:hypothetical protein
VRRTPLPLTRIAPVTVLVLALAALTASAADGTTFCVHPTAAQHCVGTAKPDLQSALIAAKTAPNDTHRNKVIVGNPGPVPAAGYSYSPATPATNPVDIVGAGQATTTLTYSGASASTVLALSGDGSSVSNLKIVLPAAYGGTGLVVVGGSARGILVTSPGPQTQSLTGIVFAQGSVATAPARSLSQSSVVFPKNGGTVGQTTTVLIGGVSVSDIVVTGQNTGAGALYFTGGASGYPNVSTLRRARVTVVPQAGSSAFGMGVASTTVKADNVALSVTGGSGPAFGVEVNSSGPNNATLNLGHASIDGNGDLEAAPSSFGVYATASSGSSTTIKVRNSIVRNFFYATLRSANGSGTSANVRYDFSDYDVIHRLDTNSSGGTGKITKGAGNLDTVNPGWLNPAAGDFRIPASSPVVNRGAPAGLNSLIESTTDVLGRPRISGRRRDMGAVEFQFPPPKFSLGKGTFDPSNGKVELPALCRQPATDRCIFKVKLKAKLTAKINGKTKHKTVTLHLNGTAVGGDSRTLKTKLPSSALPFVADRSKLTFKRTGTVTDNDAAVAKLAGKAKLSTTAL